MRMTLLAGTVADFMNDQYGEVVRNGSTWTATDGGATLELTRLTEDQAAMIDQAARAYPDA